MKIDQQFIYTTNLYMKIRNPHLEGGPFFWEGGAQGILLVHGFTATVAEVRPLAERLRPDGYTIAAPLLPGHYTEPADLNRVRWQDWVGAVEEMYQRLKTQCERVVVGGESTGGLLSLYLASQHPEVAGILLYAPALRLTLRRRDVLRLYLAAPFRPWVPKQNIDSNELWQGYPVNPLKGTIQLLALQRQMRPRLKEIHQPVLIVQGQKDTTVHPGVPEMIYQGISSTIKEMYWMERSAHCVILDCELEQVTQINRQFLEKVFPNERANGTP
jgi:carboxylesterase